MKITDFATRTAFFDAFVKPHSEVLEVGTDVGAHSESLLAYCHIAKLTIVDVWSKEYCQGYCVGRLSRWHNLIILRRGTSHEVAKENKDSFDGIYIDITHDYFTVKQSLEDWWPRLRTGGILGYRNYSDSNVELKKAVDMFISEYNITKTNHSAYHNEIVLFK